MIYRILSFAEWGETEWQTAEKRTAPIDAALGRSLGRAPQTAQREHMAAWWLTQELLEQELGHPLPPHAFAVGEHGKPSLLNGETAFNMSHTSGYAMCAVHPTAVGVDIQAIRPVTPQLIRRVCTPSECAYIGGDPAQFAAVFTAKEAYVKYQGIGLSAGLQNVVVATETGLLPTVNGCTLFPISGEEYRAAIVFEE